MTCNVRVPVGAGGDAISGAFEVTVRRVRGQEQHSPGHPSRGGRRVPRGLAGHGWARSRTRGGAGQGRGASMALVVNKEEQDAD